MPVPGVWGPVAWSILHGIGAKDKSPFPVDLYRETIWLLKNLEFIIPCSECREHIREYQKHTSYPKEQKDVGEWIWKFHDGVNKRLGKEPSPDFSKTLGSDIHIMKKWKEYKQIIKDSILTGHVRGENIKSWERHLYLWKSFS